MKNLNADIIAALLNLLKSIPYQELVEINFYKKEEDLRKIKIELPEIGEFYLHEVHSGSAYFVNDSGDLEIRLSNHWKCAPGQGVQVYTGCRKIPYIQNFETYGGYAAVLQKRTVWALSFSDKINIREAEALSNKEIYEVYKTSRKPKKTPGGR